MGFMEKILGWMGEDAGTPEVSPLSPWLKIPRLSTLLPYEGYDPDSKLFFNRQATGFVLWGAPLVGASLKDQGQIADFFRQETHFAEGTSFQVLLWASPRVRPFFDYWLRHKEGEVFKKLAERRRDFLEKKAFEDPLGHLVRDFKVIFSYTVPGLRQEIAEIESLQEIRRGLQGVLEMMGMPTEVMDARGLINSLSEILNLEKTTHPEALEWNEAESLSRQILSPSHEWKVEPDGVLSGDWLIRSWVPRSAPKQWGLPHMDRFLGHVLESHHAIPCPYLMHYGLFVESHQTRKKGKLNTRRESLENSLKNRMTKWLPGLQERYQETVEAVEQLQLGERCIVSSLSVTTFCPPEEKMRVDQSLKRIWTSLGWQFVPALYDHLGILLSSLPMMWTLGEKRKGLGKDIYGCAKDLQTLGKAKRTLTRESQNLLPILGEWKGQPTPGMVLIGRRGQPFFWSPFGKALVKSHDMQTNHDYNLCIAGTMGSGKSVLMNELMTNILSIGGRVIVLDKGRSFKNTCLLLGGQHIEFNLQRPLSLNPFTHIPEGNDKNALRDEGAEGKEMLSLLNPLIQMMASPLIGTTDAQDNYIAKAINGVWEKKRSRGSIDDIATFLSSQENKEAQDVDHLLHQFTRGGDYGCFFNDPANVDLNRSLVVIETDDLRNHPKLLPVVIQMLIIQVNQLIAKTDRSKPFLIMIDEMWELVRGKKTGPFIEQSSRTIRKLGGSLVLATQSTKDYFREECPGATVAWENSAWKCILSQDDGAINEMKNIKALQPLIDTDYKESLLKSLRPHPPHYSEVALFGKDVYGIVGRLRLDPFSRLLYSSNPAEFSAITSRMTRGMSVEAAIEDVIAEQEGRAA